jgi:hypothetical protein
MAESNSKSVPIDSLNSILAYLDTECRRHEDAGDEKRFDPIFGHVANVHEWLNRASALSFTIRAMVRKPQ